MENKNEIRIALVGGGTGGHFYPLIALAEQLNRSEVRPRLYYFGPEMYDERALGTENITFINTWAGKQRRYVSVLNFFDIFITIAGTFVAFFKLFAIYPDVLISKGGYTSVPVVLSAAFLRIPIIVHESDAVMGRANKVGARFAHTIITTYATMALAVKNTPVYALGIPIRQSLLTQPDAAPLMNIQNDRPILFVIGGSQGAVRINELILDSLDELLSDFTIIHQTGRANHELCVLSADNLIVDAEKRAHYHPVAFLSADELNKAYTMAHLIISRAGSTSIYEIALHGKPSIIIPIPEEISHDQRTNAYSYARSGAAVVMEEANLTDGLLRAEIDRIMLNQEVYETMSKAAQTFGKTDAAAQMTSLVIGIAQQHYI